MALKQNDIHLLL